MKIFLSWIQAGKESSNAFKSNTNRDQENSGSMSIQFSTRVHAYVNLQQIRQFLKIKRKSQVLQDRYN